MKKELTKLGLTSISDEERSEILAKMFSYDVLRDALYGVVDTEIILNVAKCLTCGDIIESKHVHDFVSCKCGNLHVDGGKDYLKRGWHTDEGTGWIDLSVMKDKYP